MPAAFAFPKNKKCEGRDAVYIVQKRTERSDEQRDDVIKKKIDGRENNNTYNATRRNVNANCACALFEFRRIRRGDLFESLKNIDNFSGNCLERMLIYCMKKLIQLLIKVV